MPLVQDMKINTKVAQVTSAVISKRRRSMKVTDTKVNLGGDCKDCSYRTKLKSDQVKATTGEHNQTLQPSYAQASANTVVSSMRKQAQQQSTCTTNLSLRHTKLYSIAAMIFSFTRQLLAWAFRMGIFIHYPKLKHCTVLESHFFRIPLHFFRIPFHFFNFTSSIPT